MVPFFSSICTVSLVSFMRNLQIICIMVTPCLSCSGAYVPCKSPQIERCCRATWCSSERTCHVESRSAGLDHGSPHKLHHGGRAPLRHGSLFPSLSTALKSPMMSAERSWHPLAVESKIFDSLSQCCPAVSRSLLLYARRFTAFTTSQHVPPCLHILTSLDSRMQKG